MARLILLVVLLACAAARADELDTIREKLARHPRLRADFEQTRRMAELQRPLVAEGRLLVWDRAGVIWQIVKPVQTAYVLRETTTIELADGRETERSAQDDAVSARVGRILNALLRGDVAPLAQWFDISTHSEPGHWTITLQPRPGPLAAFLRSMQVSGGEYAEHVLIRESGGDTTEIRFRNQRGGGALSAEERRLLGAP